MENHQLPIVHDQADVFLSEVLPSLKKIGEVEISEKVEEEIIQVPLRAKLYLEVKEDWIVGKLEYHYSQYEIDPFNGREENEIIIIRDVEKEEQIDRKSTRLNSSHVAISYAVFCLKKKNQHRTNAAARTQ